MDPDVFWDELRGVLAMHGPDALRAERDVLRLLRGCVLAMWVDGADETPIDLDGLKSLTRRHITGEPG